MGFSRTSNPSLLDSPERVPTCVLLLLLPSCCIPDPRLQPTHMSQHSSWTSYSLSHPLLHIECNVSSACFKMLQSWSPSDLLTSCGCLVGSAHTSAQSETPLHFRKCVSRRPARNTFTGSLHFFINIASIPTFMEKR